MAYWFIVNKCQGKYARMLTIIRDQGRVVEEQRTYLKELLSFAMSDNFDEKFRKLVENRQQMVPHCIIRHGQETMYVWHY